MKMAIYTADQAYTDYVIDGIQSRHASQLQQLQLQHESESRYRDELIRKLRLRLDARGLRERTREIIEGPGGILHVITIDSEGRGTSVVLADIAVKSVTLLCIGGKDSQLVIELMHPSTQFGAIVKIQASDLGSKNLYNLFLGAGVPFRYSGSSALIGQLLSQFFAAKISTAEILQLPSVAGWHVQEGKARFFCGNRCPWAEYAEGFPIGTQKLELVGYGSMEKEEIVSSWWNLFLKILPGKKALFFAVLSHFIMIFSLLKAEGYTGAKPILLIAPEREGISLSNAYFGIFNRQHRRSFSMDLSSRELEKALSASAGDSISFVYTPPRTAYSEKRISASYELLLEQTRGISREADEKNACIPVILSSAFPVCMEAKDILTIELKSDEINFQKLEYAQRKTGIFGDYIATLGDYIENNYVNIKNNFDAIFSTGIQRGIELGFDEFSDLYAQFLAVLWLVRRFIGDVSSIKEGEILKGAEVILEAQIRAQAENTDTTGLSEIFMIAVRKAVEESSLYFENRQEVTSFSNENLVAYDNDYYYFSESCIKRIIDTEVGGIPLSRFLQSLSDEGALKRDNGRINTFTTKVVLKSQEKTERRRRVAIRREFFTALGELGLELLGGTKND